MPVGVRVSSSAPGIKNDRNSIRVRSLPFSGGRFRALPLIVLLLAVVLGGPAGVWADQWPWAARPGQLLGGLALTVATASRYDLAQEPRVCQLVFYACGPTGCFKNQALTLDLTAPDVLVGRQRLHYLALDLPAGLYRLAEVRGWIILGQERREFTFPLHYLFQVREGRTIYLGRFNLAIRLLSKGREFRSIAAGQVATVQGPVEIPDLTFDYVVEDCFHLDATALLRAHPGRDFYPLTPQLMIWMED